ncbi:MAG: AAA family ATPase [Chlamydiales bacterium]
MIDIEEAQYQKRVSDFDEMAKQVESKLKDKLILTPYSFDELLNMPPKEWLLDQFFGEEDVGMVYGPPGCGKTFFMIELIIVLCLAKLLANRFTVKRQLNIAYCAGEGISGLPSRFQAAASHHGVTEIPNFTFYKTTPQLFLEGDDSDITTIKEFVDQWRERQLKKEVEPLDVLIIDTLHTATIEADENSAKDMGKVLHMCRWAASELGCVVILVHHTNKSGILERGSSALRGGMDFMIKIEKLVAPSTYAVMSCDKLKDGEQWTSQSFSLQPKIECKSVYVSWNDPTDSAQTSGSKASDKEKLKTEMKRYAGTRLTCKTLAEAIAKTETYTRKLLNELENAKECQRDVSKPGKDSSSRNPWVYWIDAIQEKEGLND